MSLPDEYLNEPPDPAWCDTHGCPRPCQHCRDEQADRQYDERNEP